MSENKDSQVIRGVELAGGTTVLFDFVSFNEQSLEPDQCNQVIANIQLDNYLKKDFGLDSK